MVKAVAGPVSVDRSGLHQLKEPNFGFEFDSVSPLHVVAAGHGAEGCGERAARGVFEGLPGFEHGLLANDAGAVDFFGVSRGVDDCPMAIQQLDGGISLIRNSNRVEEEPSARGRGAVLFGVAGTDEDAHALGEGFGAGFEGVVLIHAKDLSSRMTNGSRAR